MNNQFNLTYETDLNQGLASTTLPMLFLYDDSLAHVFTVKTTRDGKPNSLTGSTVHAYFMPSNSDECVYMAGTVDENGYAVVSLEPACYAFIGRFSLVIRAEKGSAVTSIFRGEGYVGQSHTDAILDPGEALPSLAALEARINALDAAKAPAGYGLGEAMGINWSDVDNTVAPGWYAFSVSIMINGITFNAAHMRVDAWDANNLRQTLYAITDTNTVLRRQKFAGVWGEWECENPPMVLGVEYRTTERSGGAPVYAKQVYVGDLPNASGKYTESLLPMNITPVSIQGVGVGGVHAIPIPSMHTYVSVDGEWGTLYVATDSDYSNYGGYITVKYTKN